MTKQFQKEQQEKEFKVGTGRSKSELKRLAIQKKETKKK